jgi:hypothetical protein
MNDTEAKELLKTTEDKINKIRTLNILLTELLHASNLGLLEENTREAMKPIIKEVMEKINQISRQ